MSETLPVFLFGNKVRAKVNFGYVPGSPRIVPVDPSFSVGPLSRPTFKGAVSELRQLPDSLICHGSDPMLTS